MTQSSTDADPAQIEAAIRQRLAVLQPTRLELIDDSARHAGHPGARGGGRHYRLLIASDEFVGRSRVARHRLVHDALGDLLYTRIHALSIQALTATEAAPGSAGAVA